MVKEYDPIKELQKKHKQTNKTKKNMEQAYKHLSVKAQAFFISLLIFPLFVMLLWNWIAVDLFALPIIKYFEAMGLWLLIQILK